MPRDMHFDVVGRLKKCFGYRVDVVALTKLVLELVVGTSQLFCGVCVLGHDERLDNHQDTTSAVERSRIDTDEQCGMVLRCHLDQELKYVVLQVLITKTIAVLESGCDQGRICNPARSVCGVGYFLVVLVVDRDDRLAGQAARGESNGLTEKISFVSPVKFVEVKSEHLLLPVLGAGNIIRGRERLRTEVCSPKSLEIVDEERLDLGHPGCLVVDGNRRLEERWVSIYMDCLLKRRVSRVS